MTAPRPWPTCIGPVGFALTNSTIVRRPRPASLRPKRSRWSQTARKALCQTSGARRMLRNPGPAISGLTASSPSRSSMRSTIACASARGSGFLAPVAAACCFANAIAALAAKSPCAACFGASSWTG